MKKVRLHFVILIVIVLTGCELPYDHLFEGITIDQESGKTLEDVVITYEFFPIENLDNWRVETADIKSNQYTNRNGEFKNNFITVTMTFDSLRITMTKEGYKKKVLISKRDNWTSIFRRTKFIYSFGKIELEKKQN